MIRIRLGIYGYGSVKARAFLFELIQRGKRKLKCWNYWREERGPRRIKKETSSKAIGEKNAISKVKEVTTTLLRREGAHL